MKSLERSLCVICLCAKNRVRGDKSRGSFAGDLCSFPGERTGESFLVLLMSSACIASTVSNIRTGFFGCFGLNFSLMAFCSFDAASRRAFKDFAEAFKFDGVTNFVEYVQKVAHNAKDVNWIIWLERFTVEFSHFFC